MHDAVKHNGNDRLCVPEASRVHGAKAENIDALILERTNIEATATFDSCVQLMHDAAPTLSQQSLQQLSTLWDKQFWTDGLAGISPRLQCHGYLDTCRNCHRSPGS